MKAMATSCPENIFLLPISQLLALTFFLSPLPWTLERMTELSHVEISVTPASLSQRSSSKMLLPRSYWVCLLPSFLGVCPGQSTSPCRRNKAASRQAADRSAHGLVKYLCVFLSVCVTCIMHVCMCLCVLAYVCLCVCTCMCVHAHMHAHVHRHMHHSTCVEVREPWVSVLSVYFVETEFPVPWSTRLPSPHISWNSPDLTSYLFEGMLVLQMGPTLFSFMWVLGI